MARYNTFSYSENLPKRIQTQLPENLIISGNRDPEILLILRLLSGNIKLTHNYSNKSIKSKINYFSSNFSTFQNWKKDFPKLLSEDITADDVSIFIYNTKYNNKSFYSGILSEVSHFMLHEKNKSHTSAFIYIYRVLEKISDAFPLIYSSKTQDFIKCFKDLKDLMSGSSDKSELKFFKAFILKLYKDDSISDTSVDIKIDARNSDVKEQIFKTMKEVSGEQMLHEDTVEYDTLAIKYCEMGSFIISIRNRFFHNSNDRSNNIESHRIVDSDEFFSFINPMAMYWISMVFLGVTSYSLSEFQSHRRSAIA